MKRFVRKGLAVLCLLSLSLTTVLGSPALSAQAASANVESVVFKQADREKDTESNAEKTTTETAITTADTDAADTTETEDATVAVTTAEADTTKTADTTEDMEIPEAPTDIPDTDTYYYYDDPIETVAVSTSELTYKDPVTGQPIDLNTPISVTYNSGNGSFPSIDIYYNDYLIDNTAEYPSVLSKTMYYMNTATGTYEPVTNYSYPVGSYKLVISPNYIYYNYTFCHDNVYYALSGEITVYYTVTPKDINDADISCSAIEDQTYSGTPLYPSFDVMFNYNTLVPNIEYQESREYNWDTYEYETTITPVTHDTYDYTVEYINHSQAGQGIIRITGVGNYTGTRDIVFNIFVEVSTLTYSGYKDKVYTGKAITFPGFTVSEGAKTLTNGTDYTIKYADNKKYGEASITVTGMGFYTGTYVVHFGIVPKKVTGISISSPKSLQAKITWKKCTGADGFEISRYNTKKKTYEVIANLSSGKWQVFQDANTSLKNNVSYRYRIRPFVLSKDGKTKYYGAAATKKGKVTKAFKELNIPIYTGSADVDYAAEVICKKVIKKGMSQQQKVKALYDWVVNNCTHDKDYGNHKIVYSYQKNAKKAAAYDKKIWAQIFTGKADCNFDGYWYNCSYNTAGDDYWYYYDSDEVGEGFYTGFVDGHGQFDRTYDAFQTHKGGCSYITRLFKALINHAGLECNLVDGFYVNRDGTYMYHYWCYIRVNKRCAWYDVDVATSNKSARYRWYKKGATFWHTCHSWDPSDEAIPIPSYLN